MEPNPQHFQSLFQQIESEVGKVMVGQQSVLRRVLLGFLSGGHILLEGVPIGENLIDSNVIRSH